MPCAQAPSPVASRNLRGPRCCARKRSARASGAWGAEGHSHAPSADFSQRDERGLSNESNLACGVQDKKCLAVGRLRSMRRRSAVLQIVAASRVRHAVHAPRVAFGVYLTSAASLTAASVQIRLCMQARVASRAHS